MPRGHDVVVRLEPPDYRTLERWARDEDRHAFAQARYLLVGLLRRRALDESAVTTDDDDHADVA